jgi:hypothetical protein
MSDHSSHCPPPGPGHSRLTSEECLEEAHHVVKVASGPEIGRLALILHSIGPGPLPWEASLRED